MDWGQPGRGPGQALYDNARVVPICPLSFVTILEGCVRTAHCPLFFVVLHSAVHHVVH